MGNTSSSPLSYQQENVGLSRSLGDTNKRSHSRRQSHFIGHPNRSKQLRLNSFRKDANGNSDSVEGYSDTSQGSDNYITTSTLSEKTRHNSLIPPTISSATATGQTTRNNSDDITASLPSIANQLKAQKEQPYNNNNSGSDNYAGERRLSQPIPIPKVSGNSRIKNDDSYSKKLTDKYIGSVRDNKIKGGRMNGNGDSEAVNELFKNSKVFPVEKKVDNNDERNSKNDSQSMNISPTSTFSVSGRETKNITNKNDNSNFAGEVQNDNPFRFSDTGVYGEDYDDEEEGEEEDSPMTIPEDSKSDSFDHVNTNVVNNTIHGDIINKNDEEIEANVLLDYINNDHTFDNFKVPVMIKWKGQANEVFVIGSFSDWIRKIKLNRISDNEFAIQLFLKIGFYRFQFIVDGETRWSNNLPKATEANGNFVNWFEVVQQDPYLSTNSKDQHENANYFFEDTNNTNMVTPETNNISERVSISKPRQHYSGKVINNNDDDYFGIINDDDENNLNEMKQRSTNSYTVSNGTVLDDDNLIGKVSFYNNTSSFSQPILTPVPTILQEYTSEIPDIYINTDDFNESQMDSTTMLKIKKLPQPPFLPPYLNNVLLNKKENAHLVEKTSTQKSPRQQADYSPMSPGSDSKLSGTGSSWNYENSGILSSPRHTPRTNPTNDKNILNIPNHVILNHLITTSIKNNVLAVACINRYGGKFVTQVMYCPIGSDKS